MFKCITKEPQRWREVLGHDQPLRSQSARGLGQVQGKSIASEPLGDGSTLYVHMKEYESAGSTTLGIWGSREYSYRVTGFKVKDDVVRDWAYGLFTPPHEASLLFGFEYGYDHDAMLAGIRKDYPNIMKTSSEETIAVWKK